MANFLSNFRSQVVGTFSNSATTIELQDVSRLDGETPVTIFLFKKIKSGTTQSALTAFEAGEWEAVTVGGVSVGTNEINTLTRGAFGTTAQTIDSDTWEFYSFLDDNILSALLSTKANLAGSSSQVFSVAAATAAAHATRKDQVALLTGGADANFASTPQIGGNAMYFSGVWTASDQSGAGLSFTTSNLNYWRLFNKLYLLTYNIIYPTTADVTNALIGTLPAAALSLEFVSPTDKGFKLRPQVAGSTNMRVTNTDGTLQTNANLSGVQLRGSMLYSAT